MAFYPASFLAKTCHFLFLTDDAPSVALLVCSLGKMPWSLAGHGVPDTVKDGMPSRREKNYFR
jgi:hypothetical protein